MSRLPQIGRRGLLLGVGACLSGCGFRPVYAPTSKLAGGAQTELGAVDVGIIPDRGGQLLRQSLQERLDRGGLAEAKRYDLTVSFGLSVAGLGIQSDSTITRLRLVGTGTWSLKRLDPGRTLVTSGVARSLDGFNVLDQQYFAADMENESAQRRIADALAEQITLQIASYFSRHAQTAG
ncbi:MAG: LPS assembly lipoprotein LptE [Acetobacteraceae bacterium]